MKYATEREPWHRLEDESGDEFAAFCGYRDQTPGTRVVSKSGPQTARQLGIWCARYVWEIRVASYDQHLDNIRVEVDEEKTRDARELLYVLYDLADIELRKYLAAAKEADMPGMISPNTLSRMIRDYTQLDRLSRGEATEIVSMDLSNLSDEELEQAALIAEKING